MITFDRKRKVFHLKAADSSYILGVAPTGDLQHLYWGAALSPAGLKDLLRAWAKVPTEDGHHISLEKHPREYADFGHNDLRTPAFHLEHADGTRISEFKFAAHRILPGKPDFGPGPSAEGPQGEGVETLKVTLKDSLKGLVLDLYYTLHPEGILVRRTALRNDGRKPLDILKLSSASLDLPAGDYRLLSFTGRWAMERQMKTRPLYQGTVRLESRMGISSHEANPFAVVTRGETVEERGEAFGLALATSGNWTMEFQGHTDGSLRVNAGLNDFDFKWRLAPGQAFLSPECVMVYSGGGFSDMSLRYHRFIRRNVLKGAWKFRPRPVLINNWEATYFKFRHENILRIARTAATLGVELMVLDDGWFGHRDDDTTSLGDWTEDKRKLPRGLSGLARGIRGFGLKFGLWIEPEMVSPRSTLYRRHPDWCLHVPGRKRKQARSQLVLDMSRPEVRDYLFEMIGKALEEAKVDYVKWDMNRSLSEVGNEVLPPARQRELYHRYLMGVYDLMDRLNRRFPKVLFEGCSGGGARFDLGILNYHPQIWTSDNTDGLDRLFIQYATSFCYAPLVMGAHVSTVPNHQTRRVIPLKWRALVAMSGNFGLELDVSKMPEKELKELAGYIALYKEIRVLVQFGDFYRLESPYDSDRTSWVFVDEARAEALLFVFQVKPWKKGTKAPPIPLRGLDPIKKYEINGSKFAGKKLMKEGWLPKELKAPKKPYTCGLYRLKAD